MSVNHTVRQRKERGRYDRASAYRVLDAGLLAHVGFVEHGQPTVIPMLYARDGDRLLLHGGVASRLLARLAEGVAACVTVSHLDGLVLAPSTFHHSANYRSVVVFGRAYAIQDPYEKARALDHLVEFMVPGRTHEARPGDPRELQATALVAMPIETFSMKQRNGGAAAPEAQDPSDVWSGVVPITQVAGQPLPERDYGYTPDYLEQWPRGQQDRADH